QGPHFDHAQQHLHRLVADMVADGAAHGELRDDVGPDELAAYCLYAASAATTLASKTAVKRLIDVTLGGLRPTEKVKLSRRRAKSLGEYARAAPPSKPISQAGACLLTDCLLCREGGQRRFKTA